MTCTTPSVHSTSRRLVGAATALVLALLGGCRRSTEPEQGVAPPPVPSARVGLCKSGGSAVTDVASRAFFPRQVAGYCIDPNGETRAYGADATAPIDQVCLEQFDGECEIYKGFGLDRVVTLRYVDGGGTTGEVSVSLARFETRDGSYGFFTRRVVAGQDPTKLSVRPLAAGGVAALGTGIAYVWRGFYVAQLSYSNTEQAPKQLAAASDQLLPQIARALGDQLPGDRELPVAVGLLPKEELLPLGIEYAFSDVLDVSGTGNGAVGHYQRGARRWRILAAVRPEPESAKDVFDTFCKLDGAKKMKKLPFDAVRFSQPSQAAGHPVRWLVVRRGTRLFGVGDEPHALPAELDRRDIDKVSLDDHAKFMLAQRLLNRPAQPPASASAKTVVAAPGSALR